jgi:hypothetical protein
MSLAPLQQYHANHPFAADIFGPYPPGAVELARFWKLGLANLTRGPPNKPSDKSVVRRLASQSLGSQRSLRKC